MNEVNQVPSRNPHHYFFPRIDALKFWKVFLFLIATHPFVTSAADWTGVPSPYTAKIDALMASHFPSDAEIESSAPLWLKAWKTADNDLYMGAEQAMIVPAPLSAVKAVIDDFDHYAELFPGYKEVKLIERSGNTLLTAWEQIVPLFFVPNVKYQMIYRIEDVNAERRIYRYQLRQATTLTQSDGMIILEAVADASTGPKTRFREIDFFDANWGPATFLGKDRLWSDTLEGLYLSDVAIRVKAMHPEWKAEAARDEAKKILRALPKNPIEHAVKNRAPLAERGK